MWNAKLLNIYGKLYIFASLLLFYNFNFYSKNSLCVRSLFLMHHNVEIVVEAFLRHFFAYPSFSAKNAEAHARGVAVPDRFHFRDLTIGCAVVLAAILSRRQLSADLLKIYLRWIKRADRRGSREQRSRSVRPNPRRTTVQRHTILLLKASAPLKRESFIFEQAIIHATAKGESNRVRKQPYPYFLVLLQWWVQQTPSLKHYKQ